MAKLPAIQFYPGDWLRDSVAGCSLAAQGLWLRMMFLMHDSDRYGYLCHNGVPIPPETIAKRCSCDSLEQYTTLVTELLHAGVPSKTSTGIIYSRRMVEDAKKRSATAGRVAKFRCKSRNDNENSNAYVTHDVTHLKHRASSSVSSSISASAITPPRDFDEPRGPKIEHVLSWLKDARESGADYSEAEARSAWLAFNANGWMWGKNPVSDWRSAVERQIQKDREQRGHVGPVQESKPEHPNTAAVRARRQQEMAK